MLSCPLFDMNRVIRSHLSNEMKFNAKIIILGLIVVLVTNLVRSECLTVAPSHCK
jgi:hypothetical protein